MTLSAQKQEEDFQNQLKHLKNSLSEVSLISIILSERTRNSISEVITE
jgi:hypothetical protein